MKKILLGVAVSLFLTDSMRVQAEEYLYDELNRVTKVIYEDGSFVEYEYDRNGNILSTNMYDAQSSSDGTQGKDDQDDENQNGQDDDNQENDSTETDGTTSEEGESVVPGEGEESDNADESEEEKPSIVEEIVSFIRSMVDSIMNWFWSIFG